MTEKNFNQLPIWQGLENLDPMEIPWNQGIYEPLFIGWSKFWNGLTKQDKENYFKQNNPPEKWKDYIEFNDSMLEIED